MSIRHTSIAILPFENLSGSPEDARLAQGFSQDLIAELARFPTVGVIAAESSFAVQASGMDDAGLGRRLDVGYLLKGSVRRSARALRFGVQLVQVASGEHVWAERYDVPHGDIFAVQDEIAAKVAYALTMQIDQTVLLASRRRPTINLAAYECWLRGMECLQRGTLESDDEARAFFEQALAVDPQFARAQAGLSLSHFNEWSCQAWDCWEVKERAAYECALKAEELDPDDALVQTILAKIEQYRRHHTAAGIRYQRALALAPNDAFGAIQLALGFALLGNTTQATDLAQRALMLNPLCPAWWHYYASIPYFVQRDYQTALELGLKSPVIVTDGPAYLAATYAYLGDQNSAQNHLNKFLKAFSERIAPGRSSEPDEPLRWLIHVNPYQQKEDSLHFTEGMRLAGLGTTTAAKAPGTTKAVPPISWPIGNAFRNEGALWMACFEHEVVHVPEVRGFRDIAQLLARPEEEKHCSALNGQPANTDRGTEVLDEQARRAYRTRLREIDAELAKAGEANDPGRAERLDEEKEQLLDEMRKATGLGGRNRKMGDGAERARAAVTWRIRHAIKKLEPAHPALARHLKNSIRTGVFCSYHPEKETQWIV